MGTQSMVRVNVELKITHHMMAILLSWNCFAQNDVYNFVSKIFVYCLYFLANDLAMTQLAYLSQLQYILK